MDQFPSRLLQDIFSVRASSAMLAFIHPSTHRDPQHILDFQEEQKDIKLGGLSTRRLFLIDKNSPKRKDACETLELMEDPQAAFLLSPAMIPQENNQKSSLSSSKFDTSLSPSTPLANLSPTKPPRSSSLRPSLFSFKEEVASTDSEGGEKLKQAKRVTFAASVKSESALRNRPKKVIQLQINANKEDWKLNENKIKAEGGVAGILSRRISAPITNKTYEETQIFGRNKILQFTQAYSEKIPKSRKHRSKEIRNVKPEPHGILKKESSLSQIRDKIPNNSTSIQVLSPLHKNNNSSIPSLNLSDKNLSPLLKKDGQADSESFSSKTSSLISDRSLRAKAVFNAGQPWRQDSSSLELDVEAKLRSIHKFDSPLNRIESSQ